MSPELLIIRKSGPFKKFYIQICLVKRLRFQTSADTMEIDQKKWTIFILNGRIGFCKIMYDSKNISASKLSRNSLKYYVEN